MTQGRESEGSWTAAKRGSGIEAEDAYKPSGDGSRTGRRDEIYGPGEDSSDSRTNLQLRQQQRQHDDEVHHLHHQQENGSAQGKKTTKISAEKIPIGTSSVVL